MKRIIPILGLFLALASSGFAQRATTTHHKTVRHHRKTVKKATVRQTHPAGATALCNDGTYSYSQHHRGTCSWHGGVKEWYR